MSRDPEAWPKGWKGRQVECVTRYDDDPAPWWYFENEVAARNEASERVGRGTRYRLTGRRLQHPVYPQVKGNEWREIPDADRQ